ncbi:histidinol-phosphate transaminase [Longimicrobium terrae]|uniref:Histidinol-phosphate aminotransferase n=1 Tax=Longimicrobium terrae TaxID=1639882 RepID=A0A841H1U9_9BACT|nr:histidinol-phosphate transaminase [Longimicrobium terrae]MBB4637461.1 histidinol-phosphate aminotransferase [Longimicrobium terrae]MBB6071859.1 histidinol-phosphate aminotransferase [Longimicrobium terrae]NNC30408.1 histidinol-phosphate transaminase [Longimicrobium terrae]
MDMMEARAEMDIDAALRWIKPSVREMGAYTLKPTEPRIKLNQNESPYDLPDVLKARIHAILADRPWNRYPPFVASNFISAVSEATGWPEEGVLVANGSNELIQAVLAVTVGPGVSVVIPEPTFTLYRLMTDVNGGTVVSVALTDDLAFDVDAIIRAARDTDAAVVVLCTPNNPTGGALSENEIRRIHDETDALILLDQAYIEFGGYDGIPMLADRPRLVVLRTFSKAMAMAGLRAGYMLAHPALAAEVHKAKLPYNINFFTEVAAAEVLRSRALLAPMVAEISAERDRIAAELARVPGLRVYPSDANFLVFRVETDAITHTALFDRLLAEYGILVRDVSKYPLLERCLRVNAGTPAENDAFLDAVRTIMTEAGR